MVRLYCGCCTVCAVQVGGKCGCMGCSHNSKGLFNNDGKSIIGICDVKKNLKCKTDGSITGNCGMFY